MLLMDKKLINDVKFNLPYVVIIALSSVVIYMTVWIKSLYMQLDAKNKEMLEIKKDEANIFRRAFFQTNDILQKTHSKNESNTNPLDNLSDSYESAK